MTLEIAIVLSILAVATVLFITEKLRMDLVGLLVLAALAVSGLVKPADAFSGFSNPAVVTVWAMFILSGGLTRTGVASVLGRHVLRFAGNGETRMVIVIMVTAAFLSAFMNNIGVAALMLPVVMDIARQTGRPPSRLLMPLAYASLLGGLTTLIGTPPNLLASEALREEGLKRFELFDFMPVGGVVAVGGILFIAFVGRRLLPAGGPTIRSGDRSADLRSQYGFMKRTAILEVPPHSLLAGTTLADSRLGSATGVTVVSILRDGRPHLAPSPDERILGGDRLLVQGRLDRFEELRAWRDLEVEKEEIDPLLLSKGGIAFAEVRVAENSSLTAQTLHESGFRKRFGVNVLAVRRVGRIQRANLQSVALRVDDRLLVQGEREQLENLESERDFDEFKPVAAEDLAPAYHLHERLFCLRAPAALDGRTLEESRIGDAFGLRVLEIIREGLRLRLPAPEEALATGDRLLVAGRKSDIEVLRGVQQLQVADAKTAAEDIESEDVGLAEVTLFPHTSLVGKTLRALNFREKYGLQVVAVWREGKAIQSHLRDVALQLGDALLLLGPREKRRLLAKESDFIMLSAEDAEPARTARAPVAAIIMLAVVVPVVLGWLPIAVASVAGAALMIAVGCLTMDEAYEAIEWRAIFLIAGMLPLGTAMQDTGAANLIAETVVNLAGPLGPWGLIAALYLVTSFATMIIPTSALVVLMAPIVIRAADAAGFSPQAGMMAIAVAASASFTSPISHPANILVMGPGGYRFSDYLKVGVPLTFVTMLIALVVLPIFWPL